MTKRKTLKNAQMSKAIDDALTTDVEILEAMTAVKGKPYVEIAQVVANMMATHVSVLGMIYPQLIRHMLVEPITICDKEVAKKLCELAQIKDVKQLMLDARTIANHRLRSSENMAKTLVGNLDDILKGADDE